MEPNTYQYQPQSEDPSIANRRRFKMALLAMGAIIAAFIAYQLYLTTQFRIISTNPKTNAVAAISPFFKITFSKPLSGSNISISMSPDALRSYTVDDRTLDITLNDPLDTAKTYVITIASVASTDGAQIINKKITFTPKDISFDDLPADQQEAIKKVHPPANDQRQSTTFTGTPELINQGLTTAQINDLVQAFTNFAPKAQVVTVDTGSITTGPLNPNASIPENTLMFNVNVDTTAYKATVTYSDLLSLTLQLFNPQTNQQVFNSGVIGSSS